MDELIKQAHKMIEAALPEGEPDCVPDWVCELLIQFGMGEANKGRKPIAWWDKSVGGFYMSHESIPPSALQRNNIAELYE